MREREFPPHIKIQLLHSRARVPGLGSSTAAGFDLYAVQEDLILPGKTMAVPLGFSTELPDSIHGRIESRSGMALRGYVVLTGVIDSDYRGEWKVILMNTTEETFQINPGDRIAQVVFRPTLRPSFEAVDSLSDTQRGAGGFGSTGKS